MTIPASAIVQVNPGVVSAGGQGLALNGVILTSSTRVPIGAVQPFASQPDVAAYFGPMSTEAQLATNYFLGFDNKTLTPGRLFFMQYPSAAVSAYLRGTSLASMTLAQLQAIAGSLTVTVDGTAHTAAALNLSAATSFSDAAAKIATALTLGSAGAVTFDSIASAFVVTSATTGASSTLALATGTAAAELGLAAGATLSQGAVATTPAAAMAALVAETQNWATFMTEFEPVLADKEAFADWTNGQNNRFAYVCWDTDPNAIVSGNTTCLGYVLGQSNASGTILISGNSADAIAEGTTLAAALPQQAAFVMGMVASIDYAGLNTAINTKFKSQSGLLPTVLSQSVADILTANGYNYYGAWATANDTFQFFSEGQITGPFDWIDPYVNQVWLNSQFQLELMTLLKNTKKIPYNPPGYAQVKAACKTVIKQGLQSGVIQVGVVLSDTQASEVNAAAGTAIDTTLTAQGWYLQVLDPGAQVRGNRGTPIVNFWYTDGGAVNKISMASIDVQ